MRQKKYNYELAKRVQTIIWKFRDVSETYPELGAAKKSIINQPVQMYNTFKFIFENEVKEKFAVFWLSSSNKVIGYEIISEGTLNTTVVEVREVFRGAIVASCKAIIIAHNHPSGECEPSPEDISRTEMISKAGSIIGIPLFDHIIFANKDYYSFVEHGKL